MANIYDSSYSGYQGYTPTRATNIPRTPIYRSSYAAPSQYSMSYFAMPYTGYGNVGGQQKGAPILPTLQDLPSSPLRDPRSAAGGHLANEGEGPFPAQTPYGAPIPPVVDNPAQSPGAPVSGDVAFPDINLDPLLLGTRAEIAGQRKQLAESDLSAFQQALLGFGSQDIARQILSARAGEWKNKLGRDIDVNQFASGLSDNPDTSFSTLAQIKRRDMIRKDNTLEQLGNLFYSGAGGRRMDQANYDFQNEQAGAQNELYAALAGLGNQYNQGLGSLRDRESQAMEGAWSRSFARWQDLKAEKARKDAASRGGGGGGGTSAGSAGDPNRPGLTPEERQSILQNNQYYSNAVNDALIAAGYQQPTHRYMEQAFDPRLVDVSPIGYAGSAAYGLDPSYPVNQDPNVAAYVDAWRRGKFVQ